VTLKKSSRVLRGQALAAHPYHPQPGERVQECLDHGVEERRGDPDRVYAMICDQAR
jgi:hypothetical protein